MRERLHSEHNYNNDQIQAALIDSLDLADGSPPIPYGRVYEEVKLSTREYGSTCQDPKIEVDVNSEINIIPQLDSTLVSPSVIAYVGFDESED